MATDNDNSQLIAGFQEPVKQFCVYDGSGRLTDLYEARANAADGAPCTLTEYEYDGASSRVLKSRESIGVWLAAYDMT